MRNRIVIGLLIVAAVAVGYVLTSAGDDGHRIKAELANAGGLRMHSSVKIAGVPAGQVVELEVTDQDTAIAELKIDDSAWPIPQGAQLNVRPTDLLGERYAEIKGGDASKPMNDGDMIPRSKTANPVELDDILNMLDADTRQRLGIMINEAGVALTGRGADFNKLLAQLPPSLHETEKLVEQIGAENRSIEAGIVRADRVTSLVNLKRGDMGELIQEASEALQMVAEKRADLGATIRNAPGALTQLRATLASLDAASEQLRPAAQDLRETAEPLRRTLEALPDFADEARPALDKANDVSPALTRLARKATPTVQKLEPTALNTAKLLEGTAPILKHMDRRGFDDLLFFVNNMNLGVRGRDAIGHFIGAKLNIASEYIDSAIENFTNVKPPARKKSERKAPAAAEQPKPAGEPTREADKPKPPAKPLAPVTEALDQTLDNVIPQTTEQVCKLVEGLGQVLGGRDRSENCKAPAPQDKQATPPAGDADALRLFDYLMGQ